MDRVARRGPLARAPGALKSHDAEKLKGGDPLRFFNIHSVAKQKKCRGDPLRKKNFEKKIRKKMSRSAEKSWKGGLFGLARYDMLRGGKTGKTILVQFARPNGAIWHHNILKNF